MNLLGRKKNLVSIALFILLVFFQISFIVIDTVWLKALTSLCFILNGLFHVRSLNKDFGLIPHFILFGLCACLLGDISIEYTIVLGAIGPGIGHICYSIAYFSLAKLKKEDIIYAIALFIIAMSAIYFVPFVDIADPSILGLGIGYSLIISIMTGKSISNAISIRSRLTFLLCLGSCLFFVSDIMVLFNHFNTGSGEVFRNIGHVIYFPAQFIISQSLMHWKSMQM